MSRRPSQPLCSRTKGSDPSGLHPNCRRRRRAALVRTAGWTATAGATTARPWMPSPMPARTSTTAAAMRAQGDASRRTDRLTNGSPRCGRAASTQSIATSRSMPTALCLTLLAAYSTTPSAPPTPAAKAKLQADCPQTEPRPLPFLDPERLVWEMRLVTQYGDCAGCHHRSVAAQGQAEKWLARFLASAIAFAMAGAASRWILQYIETRWQILVFILIAVMIECIDDEHSAGFAWSRFLVHAFASTSAIVAMKWHLEGVSPLILAVPRSIGY